MYTSKEGGDQADDTKNGARCNASLLLNPPPGVLSKCLIYAVSLGLVKKPVSVVFPNFSHGKPTYSLGHCDWLLPQVNTLQTNPELFWLGI